MVAGEVVKCPVVNDAAILILAEHDRLHAIVEDLARQAADRLERRRVACEYGRLAISKTGLSIARSGR